MRQLPSGMKQRVILGAAVGVAVVGGIMISEEMNGRPHKTNAEVEQALTAQPGGGETLAALKASFPGDYDKLIQTTAQDYNGGVDFDVARQKASAQMAALVGSHRDDLRHAPDAELVAHVRAEAALLGKLDTATCARMFLTGAPGNISPSAEVMPAIGAFSAATLRAERAGIDHRTGRAASPAPEDQKALAAAMRARGVTDAQMRSLGDGSLQNLPAADQCAIARALTGAIGELPAEQAGRVWSQML